MTEDTSSINPSQGWAEADVQSVSPESKAPFLSRFSIFVSGVCASVLIAALGMVVWFSATLPKLERFGVPDRALALMVSRMMEAQDGLRQSPVWHQWLAEWAVGSNEAECAQAIQWYQELVQTTGDPTSMLRLAILQGEFGYEQAALDEVSSWQDLSSPMPFFGHVIEVAYGARPIDISHEMELQAALAETLPAGWFYNHLAARLARRANDQALLETVERQITLRGEEAQRWTRLLLGFESVCLVLGSVMLLGIVRLRGQRMDILRMHRPGVPPPWPGGIGTAVLLRGGALGAVITVAVLSFAPGEHVSLRALAIPLANLPLLALAHVHLLKPAGLNFRNGFGLHLERAYWGRLIGIVLAVAAAGLWGEWVMGQVAEALNLTNHWTEWFDPDLVWGSKPVLAISLVEYVVFAPIFEELAFRGLLYAILRRRLQFIPAALISAGIFAIAHGYGLIGFISVLWSGFLWAWMYEKTGSLLPGMIAHALNNLFVCLAVMALLRA
jgi:membrane protease YdiL (CAAX protease family)